MTRYIHKFALFLALGASCVFAQQGTRQGQAPTTPPTFPGQQQPNPTTNPDQTPGQQTPPANPEQSGTLGQTGTTSTTAITQAQTRIQSALRQQLPASADSVNVGLSEDNKIQLTGTVSSEQEKKQIEQVARSAAPDQIIINSISVSSSSTLPTPPSSSSSTMSSATGETSAQRQSAGETGIPPSNPAPTSESTRAQTSSSGQSSSSTSSTTGSAAGESAQRQSAGETGVAPNNQTTTPESTGAQSSKNQTSTGANATASTSVQSTIQTALQQDPTLAGANINVNVTDNNKVELTGTVTSKDQKKTAKRIAETNAGGLKVVDHIKVEHNNNSATPKY